MDDIIQLIHSFKVNIRICQPENSDVHRGKAEVNITFKGGQILMLKTYAAVSTRRFPASGKKESCLGPVFRLFRFPINAVFRNSYKCVPDGYFNIFLKR